MYAFIIDDLVRVDVSRADARKYVDEILSGNAAELGGQGEPVQSIAETQEEFYARRDRELRSTWGKTPEQVAEMTNGFGL